MARTYACILLFLAAALCIPATKVEAGTARAAPKQLESTMLLTGKIDVDPDGTVAGISLDQQEKLGDALSNYIRNTVTQWHFEPVRDEHGNALAVRAPMHLRLVARVLDGDKAEVGIRSADFSAGYNPDDPTTVRFLENRPPAYPRDASRAAMGADTFVLIKVGRDGRVEDLITRQVNLHSLDSERVMEKWREKFAKATERAARNWTFQVPTEGPKADAPHWVVTVPVTYEISIGPKGSSDNRYGTWRSYVAGPLQPAPWLDPKDVRNATSPDALPDGGIYMEREDGLRLLTPLDEN